MGRVGGERERKKREKEERDGSGKQAFFSNHFLVHVCIYTFRKENGKRSVKLRAFKKGHGQEGRKSGTSREQSRVLVTFFEEARLKKNKKTKKGKCVRSSLSLFPVLLFKKGKQLFTFSRSR